MELKKLIENNEVISFDIFDTLIKRNIKRPTDVFELIEIIYNNSSENKINFKNNRILAERKARLKSSKEDVTLNEIYDNFTELYDKNQLEKLKELEKKVEISICVANKDIVKAFNYAKKLNKDIIIISDMYLTRDIIEKILEKNNITGYKKLYISSEYGFTKHSGSLFKYVCNENNYLLDKVLHIGDNRNSDIKNAKKLGMETFYIKDSGEGTLRKKVLNKVDDKFKKKNIYKNLLDCIALNNLECEGDSKEKFMYNYGYTSLGPLLYGFLNNIHNKGKKKGLEHIYFFSRDGYLLKEAYDNYYKADDKINSSYLYVSRKSLVTPMIKKDDKIEEIFDKLGIKVPISVKSFYDRFLDDISSLDLIIKKYYNSYDDMIDLKRDYEKVNNLFNDSKTVIFNQIRKQRNLLEKYLLQENINQHKLVGVMDLGWRGSLQFNLMKIINECNFDLDLYGFYLGLNEKFSEYQKYNMKAEGYIFSPNYTKYKNSILGGVGLVELMFTAPHGSVLGYKEENGHVKPILDKIEYTIDQQKNINIIQKGALDFIKDFSELNYDLGIEISSEILINPFIKLISNPNMQEVKTFGDFMFYEYGESFLAKPPSFIKAIINPKGTIKDFRKSNWKVGYMKRLLKFKFKYIKLYSIMRNSNNKNAEK